MLELRHAIQGAVSTSTISRRMCHAGLPSRVTRQKPLLSARTKQRRLQWARLHIGWTVADWSRIWFTDKSAVRKQSAPKRTLSRRPGERCSDAVVTPRLAHGGGIGAHVWGAVQGGAVLRRYLAFYEPAMNTSAYICVLDNFFTALRTWPPQHPIRQDEWICQDNAPCHVTQLSLGAIQRRCRVLRLPPYSPD